MSLRELLSHRPNTPTQQLSIFVNDEPGAGGANHRYFINGYDCTTNPSGDPRVLHDTPIVFQNGPLKEAGPNGVTNEALLAIVEDRLAAFQAGRFACEENEYALRNVRGAIEALASRTNRRVEQGVEGTHQEDQKPDPTGLGDRLVEGKTDGEPFKVDPKGPGENRVMKTGEIDNRPDGAERPPDPVKTKIVEDNAAEAKKK